MSLSRYLPTFFPEEHPNQIQLPQLAPKPNAAAKLPTFAREL